jgi:hypothetical protein
MALAELEQSHVHPYAHRSRRTRYELGHYFAMAAQMANAPSPELPGDQGEQGRGGRHLPVGCQKSACPVSCSDDRNRL